MEVDLPPEIWSLIISYLHNIEDLMNLRRVSSLMRSYIDEFAIEIHSNQNSDYSRGTRSLKLSILIQFRNLRRCQVPIYLQHFYHLYWLESSSLRCLHLLIDESCHVPEFTEIIGNFCLLGREISLHFLSRYLYRQRRSWRNVFSCSKSQSGKFTLILEADCSSSCFDRMFHRIVGGLDDRKELDEIRIYGYVLYDQIYNFDYLNKYVYTEVRSVDLGNSFIVVKHL